MGLPVEIVNSMARAGKVQDEPGISCTKNIKLFKEWWGGVKRAKRPTWGGSNCPKLEKCEHQNKW